MPCPFSQKGSHPRGHALLPVFEDQHGTVGVVWSDGIRMSVRVGEDRACKSAAEEGNEFGERTAEQFGAKGRDSDGSSAVDIHDKKRPDTAFEGLVFAEKAAGVCQGRTCEHMLRIELIRPEDEAVGFGDENGIRAERGDAFLHICGEHRRVHDVVSLERAAHPAVCTCLGREQ